ncbi:IS5 family transposase [Luteolibacter sp. LG18]|uniref:IS5 family transposase n=1 Tax=Luteolibacter sp. LG18 TaxID=2819286 RepID=UPI0030C6E53C
MATPEPSQSYPSDLTDTEWKVVEAIVGDSSKVGRPPRFERRAVINAIFYMVRTGGSWRFLPHDLPPWRIVYYYYSRWRNEGLWQKLHDGLRDAAREARAKKKRPTAAILDSQSVRTTRRGGVRGYDAGKKVLGRKRHLLVDTDGLILKVRVHGADLQDRDGARLVLDQIDESLDDLRLIWADGGYAGPKLQGWMQERFGSRPLQLDIVKPSEAQQGFAVLPRRWVVERTFGWLHQFRRLSKDYEYRTDSSEAFILIAASRILITRLARN